MAKTFQLTEQEERTAKEWLTVHDCARRDHYKTLNTKCAVPMGESYTFQVSSIGDFVSVICPACGLSEDVTEHDKF